MRPLPHNPTKARLFEEWVSDSQVRESCTFQQYLDRHRNEDGHLIASEYERQERAAIQEESE